MALAPESVDELRIPDGDPASAIAMFNSANTPGVL
jgi:hypothetical protein